MKKQIKIPKNFFEKKAWAENMYVCGMDEVGRGCLAGPLVVAAVILPIGTKCRFKDSKVLTAEEREKDFLWITQNAFYATAIASNNLIDKINIYQATLHTMKRAYLHLIDVIPFEYAQLRYLIIDALAVILDKQHTHSKLEMHNFPRGESVSTTIAAASIVAKVTRDRLMTNMAEIFPAFSFHKHKGYGTKQHLHELETAGQTIIHRASFLKSLTAIADSKYQTSLFNEEIADIAKHTEHEINDAA